MPAAGYGTAFLGQMYEPRTYRHWISGDDLVSFNVSVRETDLYIRAQSKLEKQALESIQRHREPLENYIRANSLFLHSLEPVEIAAEAPGIAREMAEAANIAGVGPMAAVAGAIAEAVGRDLLQFSPEIIVENGGDIFMQTRKTRKVGIYAGESSPFTNKLALEIDAEDTPLGICTSSGTVGHSLSMGNADAVIVSAPSTALADAAATAICNKIKTATDIENEINNAGMLYSVSGVIIIKDTQIGIWGNMKLVSLK
jgi:ApbE superfamily uncharacterized protein (UPF0280 family)